MVSLALRRRDRGAGVGPRVLGSDPIYLEDRFKAATVDDATFVQNDGSTLERPKYFDVDIFGQIQNRLKHNLKMSKFCFISYLLSSQMTIIFIFVYLCIDIYKLDCFE